MGLGRESSGWGLRREAAERAVSRSHLRPPLSKNNHRQPHDSMEFSLHNFTWVRTPIGRARPFNLCQIRCK